MSMYCLPLQISQAWDSPVWNVMYRLPVVVIVLLGM
jgi:hypothetical protein